MIKVKILEIIPETVDEEGEIYTQFLIVRHDGLEFAVFDPRMLCKPIDIGKYKNLNISIPISSSISIINESTFNVIPFIDGANRMVPNADINGVIENIIWPDKKGFPCAILNIGIGTINVTIDKIGERFIFNDISCLSIFNKGNSISIKGGCLYLDKIFNNN